jgi:predicted N-acetyltransferase YhbS
MEIVVRPLGDADLAAADRICRVAFGTFFGVPDPSTFMGDTDVVRTRWRADPSAAFGAFADGELAGSVLLANWGSIGFFGPLTIRPDLWDRGIAKRLMEAVVERFDAWGTGVAGLFTFPDSAKHIGLYQRFGFWPRFLTAIMSRTVTPGASCAPTVCTRFSDAAPAERERVLTECRALTNAIYRGLDVSTEIRSVADQRLGDTLLLRRDGDVIAFAVCHCGAGTEAGSGCCYVKFGGVRPGATASNDFDRLLEGCDAFAAQAGVPRLKAGVNTARHEAYEQMLARGFRVNRYGLAMQRPDEAGYNRPGIFVLDDWL